MPTYGCDNLDEAQNFYGRVLRGNHTYEGTWDLTLRMANLWQVYDGSPKPVEVVTEPTNFAVAAVVTASGYQGATTSILNIRLSDFDIWRLETFGASWESDPDALPSADLDQDGASNYAEYHLGTDAVNPSSRLRLTHKGIASGLAFLEVSPAVKSGNYLLKSWKNLSHSPSTRVVSILEDAPRVYL